MTPTSSLLPLLHLQSLLQHALSKDPPTMPKFHLLSLRFSFGKCVSCCQANPISCMIVVPTTLIHCFNLDCSSQLDACVSIRSFSCLAKVCRCTLCDESPGGRKRKLPLKSLTRNANVTSICALQRRPQSHLSTQHTATIDTISPNLFLDQRNHPIFAYRPELAVLPLCPRHHTKTHRSSDSEQLLSMQVNHSVFFTSENGVLKSEKRVQSWDSLATSTSSTLWWEQNADTFFFCG